MASVRELAEELGVSTQSVRNAARELYGLESKRGKAIKLTAEQASAIADKFKEQTSKQNKVQSEEQSEIEWITNEVPKTKFKTEPKDPSILFSENQTLKLENAVLRERIIGLEEQIDLLKDQLEETNKSLEREQMMGRGFWSKLGQKLLGEGKK